MRDSRPRHVYFARPVTYYPYELKNKAILAAVSRHYEYPQDAAILDPSMPPFETIYQNLKRIGDPDAFEIFKLAARSCDYIIAVAFADGSIGAGVNNEVIAYFNRRPICAKVFLVNTVDGLFTVSCIHELAFWPQDRALTIEATREKIKNGVV
jgi:hypothetical protein